MTGAEVAAEDLILVPRLQMNLSRCGAPKKGILQTSLGPRGLVQLRITPPIFC